HRSARRSPRGSSRRALPSSAPRASSRRSSGSTPSRPRPSATRRRRSRRDSRRRTATSTGSGRRETSRTWCAAAIRGRAPSREAAMAGSRSGAPPARAVAAGVLEGVEADGAFPEILLDAELARRTLALRHVALATELVYGALRWQRYLDWILAPHSKRALDGLDTRVRVLLRL